MRSFVKGQEPAELVRWKESGTPDWNPSYRDLRRPERGVVHGTLIAEQHGLSCYCGRTIDVDHSHIEHFRPQEHYGHLELDYENLHSSCIKTMERTTPLHCGHAKGSAFDEALAISPLDDACSDRFIYTANGAIAPRDSADEHARYMIGLLKLDIPFLRARREERLLAFDEEFIACATTADLQAIIARNTHPDASGTLPEFAHVVVAFAREMLGA